MRYRIVSLLLAHLLVSTTHAQLAPKIGYLFPSGGQVGSTVDVTIGGYDWTPDMQVFVRDPRIKLELVGQPGPVIVPEPPYWFGKKARRGPFPLPRETKARLTIPADVEPGVYEWQAANANGATAMGHFAVGVFPELLEVDERKEPQQIDALPVTISGQIKHIEEVDRYSFTAEKSGPITCLVTSRELGSILNAALEVYDSAGQLVADAVDTAGNDMAVTFIAQEGMSYTASVYDVDFRGNRAFVYRLCMVPAPRIVATIPAVGKRNAKQNVELIVDTGKPELESLTRAISFPAVGDSHSYRLDGIAAPFELLMADNPDTIENDSRTLTLPTKLTGVLDQRFGEDRYRVSAAKGDMLAIDVQAQKLGVGLDVAVTVFDSEGKQLAQNDDVPGTTNASLQFKAPADGEYQIAVTDSSGLSGNQAAVYRLLVAKAESDFSLTGPELLNVQIGAKGRISLKAKLLGGFKEPVAISLEGLPDGVTVPEDLSLAAGKTALNIELTVSDKAPASASLVTVLGTAKVGEETIRRTTTKMLVATTIKPPFLIDAEGKDDVTKWPRGTTFPAPALIERDEGFTKDIVLEMHSKQGRHRQGIRGPELKVPPGAKRVLYPVFLPEWLETTRTSRMVVNGVAKVADPQGNVRYSVVKQKTRMGFLPTGALLKLSAKTDEFEVKGGQQIVLPLSINRAKSLFEPARLELVASDAGFAGKTIELDSLQKSTEFEITAPMGTAVDGEYELTIRATVLQDGHLPVVSETKVLVLISK